VEGRAWANTGLALQTPGLRLPETPRLIGTASPVAEGVVVGGHRRVGHRPPYATLGRPRRLLHRLCACLRFDGSLLGASDQGVMWSNVWLAPSWPKWVISWPQMAHGTGNTTSRLSLR
jgi:hypothetical protein